jgi:hypothetical protein
MTYPENCPEDVPQTYPRRAACPVAINRSILPDDLPLDVWAYELDFLNFNSIAISASRVNCAYVLVLWKGEVSVDGSAVEGCCGRPQAARLVTGEVTLTGTSHTRAFVIAYAARHRDDPLATGLGVEYRRKVVMGHTRNGCEGTVLKILVLDGDPTACFAQWEYGAYAIFDESSPRIFYRATPTSEPSVTEPQEFGALSLNRGGLIAFERRNDSDDNVVLLLDFADPSDAGTEGGCSYRCFGSGLEDVCTA